MKNYFQNYCSYFLYHDIEFPPETERCTNPIIQTIWCYFFLYIDTYKTEFFQTYEN